MRNWPLLITALSLPVYWFLLAPRLVRLGRELTASEGGNVIVLSPTPSLIAVVVVTLLLGALTYAVLRGLSAATRQNRPVQRGA